MGCLWEHFSFLDSDTYVFMQASQVKISSLELLFLRALKISAWFSTNSLQLTLQYVFPVLLFNPHSSDSVWMKTDYDVHVLVFRPGLLPSLLRTGGVVVLGFLLQGLERHRGPVSPPSSLLVVLGEAAPCSHIIMGTWVPCMLLLTFSTWI